MMNETVQSIMIKELVTLGPESTLQHVKDIFTTKRIHHIPIIDEGKLVGLITTYDLWMKNYRDDEYKNILVKDVMTKSLVKISPEDKVGTAAELFLSNRFHALPVVKDEFLVGLVTTFDVLRYEFKKEYPEPILYKDIIEDGIKAGK